MSSSSQIYGRAQARSEALAFHFELGLSAYDSGDVSGVLRHLSALGLLPEGGSECAEFLALRWRALWLQGERDEALEVAQRAARWNPNDPDAAIELAEPSRGRLCVFG